MPLRGIRRRPAPAPAAPEDGEALLPWYAFEPVIERSLALLHGVHIPLSLFAIRSDQIIAGQASTAIAASWCRYGAVGRLPDASIGLLYLGPHERPSDAALAQHLRRRIERYLLAFDLAVAQGWSDEIEGAEDLVNLLDA